MVAVLVVSFYVAPFAVDATTQPEPVRFGETVESGLSTGTVRAAQTAGHVVPKVQVAYARYESVVGYYGVESYLRTRDRAGRTRRFGPPLAVYVTDFAGTDPQLTSDGFVALRDGARPAWTAAGDAVYVVSERDARRAAVPFGDRAAAERFAATHGGRVFDWEALVAAGVDGGEAPSGEESGTPDRAADRHEWADRTVSRLASLRARPVSVVVGEDAPTLAAAVERAPPNTTVYVPAGTYRGRVRVEKPVTIRGAGGETVLDGGGEGTVVTVAADRAAVLDLAVAGVGTETVTVNASATGWDSVVERTYGRGDAGVAVLNASDVLVRGVAVDTPSNGVLVRDSAGVVVSEVAVRGTPDPAVGYMGVMAMRSSLVVQRSTFRDGRDAVYSHRSRRLVVRDNAMCGGRFGVHLMFTSDALVAGNAVRDTATGVVVMTRPSGNVVVGNDVRRSRHGVVVAGADSVIERNVLVANRVGLRVESRTSRYAHNVVVDNDVGAVAANYVASNRVYANDFRGNDRDVRAVSGVLRIWSRGDRGNYWAEAARLDAVRDGPYRPSDEVDAALSRPGRVTLSRAPVRAALAAVRGSVSGLRPAGVVDEAPADTPRNPALLDRATRQRAGCPDTAATENTTQYHVS